MKMWNAAEEAKYKVQGLMLNLDNTAHDIGAVKSEEDVYKWVAQFSGTHVTDIIMNFAESKCVYPSKAYFGWYGDGMTTNEDGKITTAEPNPANPYYNHYKVLGLDYLKTLSKALPEAGINMWLSIRMNDQHDRNKENSSLFTEFYHKHPEYRRVPYKSALEGHLVNLLDYSHKEVRDRYLGLIDESLDRYDVYGFQLEWQREIRTLKLGYEYYNTEVMTQFMRDARAIVRKYEEKYGHKIMLSAQVAPDIKTNYDFGLDVLTWIEEGLIDMISPKGRHATTNNEIPVRQWKNICEKRGIKVAPDIEHRIKCTTSGSSGSLHDIETYAGTAGLYLSQGADQIQLYNLLVRMSHIFKNEDKIAEYDTSIAIPEVAAGSVPGWWLIFTSIGSYDKLMTLKRKVLPTFNEMRCEWIKNDAQLPRTINNDKYNNAFMMRIGMGDVPEGAKVTLKFSSDVIEEDNPPIVYVNCEKCECIGVEDCNKEYRTKNKLYCYEIPTSVHHLMYAVVEIQNPFVKGSTDTRVSMTVDYAEVYIEPAK